jgi:2-oxoglutarate dehydrogenase E2 component (dihydrolipoamide succinyltransferase)
MAAELVLPELGPTPGEPVVLSVWFADEGDEVLAGDQLVEVLVAGSTFEVPSPASGRLVEILAYPDDELQPGQVLCLIEPSGDDPEDGTEVDEASDGAG